LSSAIDLNLQETTEVTKNKLVHRLDATMITMMETKYEIVKELQRSGLMANRLGEKHTVKYLISTTPIVCRLGFEQLRFKRFL